MAEPYTASKRGFSSDLFMEHQRIQRAIVANASGSFTPELTFNTPGDVAVTYGAANAGVYWRHGLAVTFSLTLDVTAVTFTTASGFLAITGLPFPAHSGAPFPAHSGAQRAFGLSLLYHDGLTYSAGVTWLAVGFVTDGTSRLFLAQNKSATATMSLGATNVTSGNPLVLQIGGTYLTDS